MINYNSILIRYAEIHLKGKNRGYFEKVLKTNINQKLAKYNTSLTTTSGRYIIREFLETDINKIMSLLTKTPGIYSVSPAIEIEAKEEDIYLLAKGLMLDKQGTFRVSCTRGDKAFPVSSMDLAKKIGGKILSSNPALKVDLHNPDYNLQVEVRPNKMAYLYFEEHMGVSGMPVSSSGKGLLLLSGGIDSPVAGYMMSKRGLKLSCIHFESFPYTSPQAREKAIELAKILAQYNGKTSLYVVNIAKIQEAIHEHCHADYMITLVRRFMLKIAERLAQERELQCIITGESLAQVASQTVESMTVIGESLTSPIPLLKPLVGFDKLETINIAQKIGSYEISIRPYDDCCTVFLPDSPIIKPKLDKVKREESKLDVNALIEECYQSIEKLIIE